MENNSIEWLKANRQRMGMSTYQVAKEAGISQTYYWLIENGRKIPTVRVAKRISSILLFSWTDFFRDVA